MTGIIIYQNRHTVILNLKERIDALTAIELRKTCDTLFDRGITHFVIDLSQTPVLDSAGTAVLVNVFKRCRQANGAMKLSKTMSPAAQRILRLTRFDQIFEMMEQRDVERLASTMV